MNKSTIQTHGTERGQVGIGTLIVFIAMVLVAAIAAGVLISTAGELQAQGEATGEESQSQISNNIQVLTKTASVSGTDTVESIDLVVGPAAGADTIDLDAATFHLLSESNSESLSVNGGNVSTSEITGSSGKDILEDQSDRSSISFSSTASPASTVVDGLDAGDSATIEIVDQSGASTYVEVRLPSSFASKTEVTV